MLYNKELFNNVFRTHCAVGIKMLFGKGETV